MNGWTQTRVAVAVAAVIAVLIGGLLLVDTAKGGPVEPLYIAIVEEPILGSVLTPASIEGTSRLYSGYSGAPRTLAYQFLGNGGGVNFDVDWSSVRGTTVTFNTVIALDSWTNSTTCASGVAQCGTLVLAVPSQGPLQALDFYSIDGAAEEAVADDWVLEQGSLDLRGVGFHILRTVVADIPTGAQVALRWAPWDGRGHLSPAPRHCPRSRSIALSASAPTGLGRPPRSQSCCCPPVPSTPPLRSPGTPPNSCWPSLHTAGWLSPPEPVHYSAPTCPSVRRLPGSGPRRQRIFCRQSPPPRKTPVWLRPS